MANRETLRMDGIISDEDIADRHYIIRQCDDCNNFTKWDMRNPNRYACATCGSTKYDPKTQHSVRTHGAFANRRKSRKKVK